MGYSTLIVKLFSYVLEMEENEFSVAIRDVRQGMEDMADAYRPCPLWLYRTVAQTADYNKAAHRCAYLHKYAMLHTRLVITVLELAFDLPRMKKYIDSRESLKVCSLGGGPGTDVVALLLSIQKVFGLKNCTASIVDYSPGWEHTFAKIVAALRGVTGSEVSSMVDESRFDYQYLGADLLNPSSFDDTEVREAVGKANILTMVKFVSAAACDKTGHMLENIFQTMKPGSMLLFIDSAGGGFHEMVESKALKCGLKSVFGSMEHLRYEGKHFNRTRYGCAGQHSAKVTFEMWRKPRHKT